MGKDKTNNKTPPSQPDENDALPDYPLYPPEDDIYNRDKKEDLDPDIQINELTEKIRKQNERDFDNEIPGSDLDVPGSELDDDQENVGSEDEENNYYSLGEDNGNDLE
jgi:hypothetical protein